MRIEVEMGNESKRRGDGVVVACADFQPAAREKSWGLVSASDG